MVKALFTIVLLCLQIITFCSSELNKDVRVIILADMGNEPDEEQQMVHMLVCSNEFHLEGLIAVTGKYINPTHEDPYKRIMHPELFHKLIDAYSNVLDNLKQHANGWHSPEYLHSIVVTGQLDYGIDDVGDWKSSEGSKLMVKAFEKEDDRPIWIVVNAGSNTFAQALWDYRKSHSGDELLALQKKLRVYENGAQDNAGAWICKEFPGIQWIRSNFQTYAYGGPNPMYIRKKEFGPYCWQPFENSPEGQHAWTKEHIQTAHGPLGEAYPDRVSHKTGKLVSLEGGGTGPWIGLANKGLFDIDHPHWGGWGGRFSKEKVADFWSRHKEIKVDEAKYSPFYVHREVADEWTDPSDGKIYNDEHTPMWRWRKAMFNDFAARMDWCVSSYEKANHHPVAVVNGDKSDHIIKVKANAGEKLHFDAGSSFDPDGDDLAIRWWNYFEAGTYPKKISIQDSSNGSIKFKVPKDASGKQIHIILEVIDNNKLVELHDYRRIVINVK